MNADLGNALIGVATSRPAIDQLADAIEEAALLVLDAERCDLVLETEQREFAHRMGNKVTPTPSSLISGAAS